MPTALITGITGQDGSYLAEFLLEKGYEVVGLVRRTSTVTFDRIAHIQERLLLVPGDLLDEHSLIAALREYRPSEVYNLAAQSFIQTSWSQPVFTGEVTALGVTRILDAIRNVDPSIRFYQASSSEMFGKVREVPQNELTPFYPRSPYGVAKVYGHWITVNYRESHDLYAVSGILFNHECVAERTPLLLRRDGQLDVAQAGDLVPLRRKGPSRQHFEPPDLEVWDGRAWSRVLAITATRRRSTDPDHTMLSIQARAGVVEATAHHSMLVQADPAAMAVVPAHNGSGNGATMTVGEYAVRAAGAVVAGDRLALAETMPDGPDWTVLTPEMAELLGQLTADGYVSPEPAVQPSFAPWLREQLYADNGHKRVPPLVLNAPAAIQTAYLQGYYAGDGLKAGNGLSVKTNSPVLALGLYWLYARGGQLSSVYAEQRAGRTYYQLNIPSDKTPGGTGQHLRRDPAEVRVVVPVDEPEEWLFDLETDSGSFMAGVGRVVVHNSPRRGLEFVTRKITDGVARIHLGQATELRLGNLDSQRDWGWAPDYVRGMWQMLQEDEPDDFVLATGETHSVEEFCRIAFAHVGRDYRDYVVVDPRFMRPAEVDFLLGDATKAHDRLGWAPTVSFADMVGQMVDADLEARRRGTDKP